MRFKTYRYQIKVGSNPIKPKSLSDPNQQSTTGGGTTTTKQSSNTIGVTMSSIDAWYLKMRQIILVEYARYFESRGFIRLKDESKQVAFTTTGGSNRLHQQHIEQQQQTQVYHFIKWIQQDGFLYITMNVEEIYLCVKLGYCTRYRSASRLGFINELIRFFTHEFHLHSFIYDFHLSAVNISFSAPPSIGMVIAPTATIISKFLDEFVEFFLRIPIYSSNKVCLL